MRYGLNYTFNILGVSCDSERQVHPGRNVLFQSRLVIGQAISLLASVIQWGVGVGVRRSKCYSVPLAHLCDFGQVNESFWVSVSTCKGHAYQSLQRA